MENSLVYVPVFRGRPEEMKLLVSFQFGERIYPYVEIVQEKDRKDRKYSFEDFYKALRASIKSDMVFVDIPSDLSTSKSTKEEVLGFLTSMRDMQKRTERLLSLKDVNRIIPVIFSYHRISGKIGTVKQQADDLRAAFPRLAFRLSARETDFDSDMTQILPLLASTDYLFVDFHDEVIDLDDAHTKEITQKLSEITVCPIVVLHSAIPQSTTYKGLESNEVVKVADNTHTDKYKKLHAVAFADYAGIKKDLITSTKINSDNIVFGFVYYDATENVYYGFKGDHKGTGELKYTVVPAVCNSDATKRMRESGKGYISGMNKGWRMLSGAEAGTEKIGTPAQFKRISMEHYVHCIRKKIENGEFG